MKVCRTGDAPLLPGPCPPCDEGEFKSPGTLKPNPKSDEPQQCRWPVESAELLQPVSRAARGASADQDVAAQEEHRKPEGRPGDRAPGKIPRSHRIGHKKSHDLFFATQSSSKAGQCRDERKAPATAWKCGIVQQAIRPVTRQTNHGPIACRGGFERRGAQMINAPSL